MNLEPYIAVSGEGGLFELVSSKSSGLVLRSLKDGKSKFYTSRKHQFTPLGTIAIYTLEDTTPLTEVFKTMRDKKATVPVVSHKAEKHQIEEYIETIIPDYDEDKVSLSDMKKIIKWFSFLDEKGLTADSEGDEKEASNTEEKKEAKSEEE